MDNKKLILIIPVYNGEKNLPNSFDMLEDFFSKNSYLEKIIFINDGSEDNTKELLDSYKAKKIFPIEIIRNEKNQGKGASVKKGIKQIDDFSGIIAFTDADLPYGLELFDRIIEIFSKENMDLVIGNREMNKKGKQYNLYRYFFKKVFSLFLPRVLKKYRDTQSGIKAFDSRVKNIFDKVISDNWCFDIELLLLAENNNLNIKEIPVRLRDRPSSGGVFLFKHGLNIFLDIIKIKIRNAKGFYKNKK